MSYHVKQGFWINYYESWGNRHILTVTDTKALILTSLLGAFIAFVGSQSWILIRRFTIWCSQTRQPGTGDDVPLGEWRPDIEHPVDAYRESADDFDEEDISQKDAMLACLGSRRKGYRHRILLLRFPQLRSRLAVVACAWTAVWLALGPAVVYILTSFGQETPMVQSGWTPCCGEPGAVERLYPGAEAKAAERYTIDCKIILNANVGHCNSFWVGDATPTVHVRNAGCPFGDDVCSQEAHPTSFEHNISAQSLGYNSPHKVRLQHRLTCAPLDLSPFLFTGSSKARKYLTFLDSNLSEAEWRKNFKSYSGWLETVNGPNEFSPNYSGWNGSLGSRTGASPRDMSLALIPDVSPSNSTHSQRYLHRQLRISNATTFVILVFQGQNAFRGVGPITDPMFRASRRFDKGSTKASRPSLWLPDREVNGIGCVEQYKLCRDVHCSEWKGISDSEFLGLSAPLQDLPNDQSLLFSNAFRYSSVLGYLDQNRQLLIAGFRRGNVYSVSKKGQWIQELQGLFDSAFLRARFTILHSILKVFDDDHCANNPNVFNGDPSFCGRLLIPASDYTNINLVWMLFLFGIAAWILAYCFSIEFGRRPNHVGWLRSQILKRLRRLSGRLRDIILRSRLYAFASNAFGWLNIAGSLRVVFAPGYPVGQIFRDYIRTIGDVGLGMARSV